MAQYKVLQDIEAEDKLLGPLSLRQFIYAAITIALGFVTFRLFISPVWFVGIVLLPPTIFFALLAAPLGGQQSSEIWLLAKIRFFLKPRKRIWDQSGVLELVTITVPKAIERHLTKGYDQTEVKSRLKTLASTMDTRGWAVKNAPGAAYGQTQSSDRLFDIAAQSSAPIVAEPVADMLDPTTNPRAQAMDQALEQSGKEHREEVLQNMRSPSLPAPQVIQAPRPVATTPLAAVPVTTPTISPADEQALLNKIHAEKEHPNPANLHMKTLQPTSLTPPKPATPTVTPTTDPAILNLVENSEDLSVETIANQANRIKNMGDSDQEVVISLH